MALPSNVGHGTVTGRFIDSTGAAIEGTVTFTPSPKRLLNATADPSPVTILPQPVTVTLNDGTFTQQLIATDDPDNNPSGWTYAVKFAFKSVSAAGFDIEVPEGATVDLTTVSPVSSGNGTAIIQGRGVPSWDDATDGQVIVLVDGEPAWGTVEGGGGGADLTSYAQVSDLADYPATFPPASHDHSISDVTGLSGALGAKADTTDLDGLATASELTSGLAGKANASHTHTIANVSGLQSALDGKQPTGDYLTEDDLPTPPDLSGYAEKSELFSGSYDDLTNKPTIPSQPSDIGAQPAGDYLTEDDLPAPVDLSSYATKAELFSGDYNDLTNKPSIPANPGDIGAQPAGSYLVQADLAGYVESTDLADVATTGAYSDLTGLPTIPDSPEDIGAQPAGSYATAAQGAKADTALQSVTLANLPAGTPLVIVWDGTGWTHGGQTITERPTSRTDITMMAYGGTEAPAFAIAGDLWTEDAGA